ncbi:MAG: phosphotransferase [Chloroflexi bacterium]|nr:phosphotransferase [Chloroflexota bacterium]
MIDISTIVDGQLRIEDASRRNRNLVVNRDAGPSYFIKQPDPSEPSSWLTFLREAQLYAATEEDVRFIALRSIAPRFVDFDRDAATLIIECYPNYKGAGAIASKNGDSHPPEIAQDLGNAMASYHRALSGLRIGDGTTNCRVVDWLPGVFDIAKPGPETLRFATEGQLEMIRRMQDAGAVPVLEELRGLWTASTLIHGDIKWDNVLIPPTSKSADIRALRLVDWELAGYGDPAWDVGSALHEYSVFVINTIPLSDQDSPQQITKAFAGRLPKVQPHMRALWGAYASACALTGNNRALFLDRAVRFCAARLIQTAWEWTRATLTVSNQAACFLQLALNILRRPQDAQVFVLGIVDDGS